MIIQETRHQQQAIQSELPQSQEQPFKKQLEALFENLQKGIVPVEFLQELLQELPQNPVHRGILLGSMMNYIGENRKFHISFEENHFVLTGRRGSIHSEQKIFEDLFNTHLQSGKITPQDIPRAFLYRTYDTMGKYVQTSGERASQSGFVRWIFEKNEHLKSLLPQPDVSLSTLVDTDEKYTTLCAKIRAHIPNQTNKEFLISYFTERKAFPQTEDISLIEYTTQVNDLQKAIESHIQETQHTLHTQNSLPVTPRVYRQMARDPIKSLAVEKMIGGAVIVGILGILGAIIGSFFGK